MVGFTETQKVAAISKVFSDSYKSPLSVIVVDNLERLLGLSLVFIRWQKEQQLRVMLMQTGLPWDHDFLMRCCRRC
jgi:vesicle-fusing ATPase